MSGNTCPYCMEDVKHLDYNGEEFSCPKCETIIATDIFEAHAFLVKEWDGRDEHPR